MHFELYEHIWSFFAPYLQHEQANESGHHTAWLYLQLQLAEVAITDKEKLGLSIERHKKIIELALEKLDFLNSLEEARKFIVLVPLRSLCELEAVLSLHNITEHSKVLNENTQYFLAKHPTCKKHTTIL